MAERYQTGEVVTILSSRLGYGQYIPSLLLRNRLLQAGIPTDLVFAEEYYTVKKKKIFHQTKAAFAGNPRLAKVASKVASRQEGLFAGTLTDGLVRQWQAQARRLFVCFSGYWFPLLQEYAGSRSIAVDCVVLDAQPSVVWQQLLAERRFQVTPWKLFDADAHAINFTITPPTFRPVPFGARPQRVVYHGGGWGIFALQDLFAEPALAGLDNHCLVNDPRDATVPGVHYYLNACSEEEPLRFPSLQTVEPGGRTRPVFNENYHVALDLIANAQAVVSKPGGMTLVDSLVTATPVVFLNDIGAHEAGNQSLWTTLGLGIEWSRWQATGFSTELFFEMHRKLLDAGSGKADLASALMRHHQMLTN